MWIWSVKRAAASCQSLTHCKRLLSLQAFSGSKKLEEHQKNVMARGLPKKRSLDGVNHVILVSSGKGGVGKSTTAVNLALSLKGYRVGLLDADVFGPSIPTMLNIDDQPMVSENKKMIPLVNYGLRCMSMGFLVKKSDPVVWRGPMVMGAIEKMVHQTEWGDLDVLLIDTPPGTGDIHLSLAQTLNVAGSVIVTTPQSVAVDDARKGAAMYEKVSIPILGVVENMGSFVCGGCGEVTHVFGEKGAERLAREFGVPLLASVPLDPEVMATSENGSPIAISSPDSLPGRAYKEIAEKLVRQLKV